MQRKKFAIIHLSIVPQERSQILPSLRIPVEICHRAEHPRLNSFAAVLEQPHHRTPCYRRKYREVARVRRYWFHRTTAHCNWGMWRARSGYKRGEYTRTDIQDNLFVDRVTLSEHEVTTEQPRKKGIMRSFLPSV